MNCIDDSTLFKDIPDSLVDIPPTQYPMVMTFYKFLMMLDGTVGISYFERFQHLSATMHKIEKTDNLKNLYESLDRKVSQGVSSFYSAPPTPSETYKVFFFFLT